MGPGHPECPERLDAIQERLLMSGLDIGLTAIEAPAASFDVLAPVSYTHLTLPTKLL
jgi:hypothetical protein